MYDDRRLQLRNRIFIALLVVSNALGNLFLGIGMQSMPEFQPARALHYIATILINRWIIGGTALMILWMIAQLSMFTWADVTYVLPVTASAYVLTAVLGKFFLNESISSARWGGIALISFGVVLVAETPPWTHPEPPKEEEP
jgi:bacterial/archaeal transporter family protein